jgi:hypothetical protein
MRRREPLDPVVERELAAIDAALAGRSGSEIAPEDAELAQLATLLVAERPPVPPEFRAALDARVASRFDGPAPKPRRSTPKRNRRPLIPASLAFACVALVALVVALQPGGGSGGGDMAASGGAADSTAEISPAAPSSAAAPEDVAPAPAERSADSDAGEGAGSGAVSPPPVGGFAEPGGRKVEQSSTVELGAPADRVDDVAQGVLGVVTRHQGIVDSSSVVTSGDDRRATFALRIPTARLQAALGELSRLPDAHVLSRTDDTVDVNQAYVSVERKLDGAEAERGGLLTALREADSEDETDRLKARLDGVEGRIAELQRAQRALDRRVDYSRVDLTVRADDAGAAQQDDDGGFTPGSALDDAGELLSVTAGVLVIAAAALVPVALLALLAWPLVRAARRRRREGALDV